MERTTTEQTERVELTGDWTYAGLQKIGREIFHYWITDEGDDWHLAQQKSIVQGASIGSVYTVRYLRRPDGTRSVYLKQAPHYVRQTDDERVTAWRATTRAIDVERELLRREKRETKDADELEQALSVLRRAYRAQRTMTQGAAFLAYCTASITKYEPSK